jgi:hypothetical protein
MGYSEFELDIPEVMRNELPKYFDGLTPEPLTEDNISKIPAKAQGAYMLFLNDQLVYIGKTDAEAGFRNRLFRHYFNIQHRKNLDIAAVTFKAVRIFVFSNFDLETMLIGEYEKRAGRPTWNFSGFGSNDPGRNRESQDAAKFDIDYPVDIDHTIQFLTPGIHDLLNIILRLKRGLPYLFRYDTQGRNFTRGHPDMEAGTVQISDGPITTRNALIGILAALPIGWQATILPNRVILYKEEKAYREQIEVLRRVP